MYFAIVLTIAVVLAFITAVTTPVMMEEENYFPWWMAEIIITLALFAWLIIAATTLSPQVYERGTLQVTTLSRVQTTSIGDELINLTNEMVFVKEGNILTYEKSHNNSLGINFGDARTLTVKSPEEMKNDTN